MDTAQTVELVVALAALVSPALHLIGVAAQPWARALLSILPDLIGMYRRAKGKAGAPGAPNVGEEES